MPSSRALFLKGILGIAGLGVTGAGGIGLGLGKTFSEGQKDQTSKDSSSKSGDAGGIVTVKDADLGIPKECDKTCVLTAEQLKKLKFEQKGNEEITFEGLDKSDEFELTIEDSEDETNYPKGKKYTLKPKTISGPVTIKEVREGDIVFEGSKEVLVRETSSGGKLEHLLEEVDRLGIPKRCKADEVKGEAKTCELTQLQLQKLKFETRDGEAKTVEGLDEGNIVTLKIEDKGGDSDNYPKGKKYTLRSATGPVTIKGVKEEDIVLGKDQEVLIRETTSGGKLEHLLEEVDRLGIPKRCGADEVKDGTPKKCDLKQKQLKDLKFEAKEGSSIAVEDQNEKITFELTIEDKPNDKDNYPKGKKYTLKSKGSTEKITKIKGVKERDIDIWGNQSVVIREISGGGKFERAPVEVDDLGIPRDCKVSCQLTEQQIKKLNFEKSGEEITVDGLNEGKTVNLTVENKSNDIENYPKGKKYILGTRKTTKTVTIKGIKGGDIVLESNQSVVIREKQNERKLEKAPEEIDNLGIPRRCKTGSTCELTKAQLEKLKFEANPGSSITVIGLGEDEKVDLKVETPSDLTDFLKSKKYTFSAKTGTVTIQNVEGGDITIEEKGVVIREKQEGGKLEKVPEKVNELGIPRWCVEEEGKGSSNTSSCELTQEQLKDLKFKVFEGGTGDVKVEGLTEEEKIKLTISWDEDTNNYPGNKKYSLDNTSRNKEIKITKGGVEVKISKQTESRFKNNEGQLEFVEAKDRDQIEREKKLAESKEILQSLGLGRLSIGDIDDSNPRKRKQTSIEFKKADERDLKKIQFKYLGGGADSVTNLGGFWGIKVYLDWEENESIFPKKMKFSFDNPGFSAGFNFWNGNKKIEIPQKQSGTPMPAFKVEKDQGKWYLVKVS